MMRLFFFGFKIKIITTFTDVMMRITIITIICNNTNV